MEQREVVVYEKKSARMSEILSKRVQDAIDGIMRNDPTMTSVNLSCELSDFDIVCRDCMILIELFWGVAIVVCFEAWAWVAIVLLVSLLNLRHHQVTKWAMLELLRLLLRWRRTAACRR